MKAAFAALAALLLTGVPFADVASVRAQTAPPLDPPAFGSGFTEPPPPQPDTSGVVELSAVFGPGSRPILAGLAWRVFKATPGTDGQFPLVIESKEPDPRFRLPNGDYVIHVAYGLASAVRSVSVEGDTRSERIPLNAGGLQIVGLLGDQPVQPDRLSVSVFVPEGNNPQGKLVARDVRPGGLVPLPEGKYHLISTYLDVASAGQSGGATNSVIDADVRIQTGKTTEATLRHRAAQMTLKLVNAPGGEALANTSFTILTPGGDVIRELIGAFPAVVLAEGEYVAIARRDGRTYQGAFNVRSTRDRDVEILARETSAAP